MPHLLTEYSQRRNQRKSTGWKVTPTRLCDQHSAHSFSRWLCLCLSLSLVHSIDGRSLLSINCSRCVLAQTFRFSSLSSSLVAQTKNSETVVKPQSFAFSHSWQPQFRRTIFAFVAVLGRSVRLEAPELSVPEEGQTEPDGGRVGVIEPFGPVNDSKGGKDEMKG